MLIAKFIGDPADGFSGPRVLRAFGRRFPKGRFVGIEGEDAEALHAKLAANNHFAVGEGQPDPDEASPEPVAGNDQAPSAFAAFDRDGDGEPGGSNASPEKDELINALGALQDKHPEAEIKYDRRWGAPKLRAALEAAQFELGDD